jgi:uncharacterized membrane protein YeaQ/YmgE (transglycosylase-associated protein family)
MDMLIWLVVGAVIGAVANPFLRPDLPHNLGLNISIGAVGAVLACWLTAPLLGGSNWNLPGPTLVSMAIAAIGAFALLEIVNLVRPDADMREVKKRRGQPL